MDLVDADLARDRLGGRPVVAGQHDQMLDPARPQIADHARSLRPHRIGHRDQAADVPLVADHHDRPTGLLERRRPIDRLAGLLAALHEVAVRAEPEGLAPEAADNALALEDLYLLRRRDLDPARLAMLDDRLGERVRAAGLERRGALDQLPLAVPVEGNDPDHGRLPPAQRAGLVERHGPERGRLLDVGAAFDQHPVPRRGGERRHDAHRRRDHERTGAGDHQQDERPVEPVAPRRAEQQRRHHEDGERERDHRWRVHAGELLDPLLGPGAPAVRSLDHAGDAGERGIFGRLGALDLERAVAVDGAGEHLAARLLGDRDALAGDRRLVDRARSDHDAAVERDALARPDDEARADRRFRGRDLPLLAGGRQGAHGRRCQVEQRRDRAACPADAPALERERQGEEKGDRRGLEPFTDADRARDRDHHQEVDVWSQAPGGVPRLHQHIANPEGDRECVGDDLGQRHGLSAVPEQPERFREPARKPGVQHETDQHRETAEGGQPDLQAPMARVTAILVPSRLPAAGAHAGAFDGGCDVAIGHVPRMRRQPSSARSKHRTRDGLRRLRAVRSRA